MVKESQKPVFSVPAKSAFIVRGLTTVVSSMGTEDRYVNFRRRLHRFSQ